MPSGPFVTVAWLKKERRRRRRLGPDRGICRSIAPDCGPADLVSLCETRFRTAPMRKRNRRLAKMYREMFFTSAIIERGLEKQL